ncbi:MAG: IPT/TIG domain-containing protein, partial [Actinomycetota bacterium]|nr:IPT/TIG domain-containing protein [Actinomycetota bacterium]
SYSACPQNFSTNFVSRAIMFSRSTDGGATWSAPVQLGTGCLEAAAPAVGADGSVYVVWYDCNSGNRQLIRKSTDGGATWGTAVAAASGFAGCPLTLRGSSFRVNGPFPSIATDPTNGSRLYIAYPACPGGYSDVFFARSTNGGSTWSTPLRVNDDPTTDQRDQFMPWIAAADDGTIRVMWGDDRLDTVNVDGKLYDIFMAESTDHGVSFASNIRVTDQSSDPGNDGFGGAFIGDYFGIAPCGTPVWTDTRNGNDDIFSAARDANGDGIVDGCSGTAPTITGFTPTSGPVGTSVTITGTNFTGATVVKFNGLAASFTVNSATQITATVPSGATTGPIKVKNAVGAATSSTNFTVT